MDRMREIALVGFIAVVITALALGHDGWLLTGSLVTLAGVGGFTAGWVLPPPKRE